MTVSTLQRKYLSLGLGELVSAAIFIIVAQQYDERAGGRALWSALLPLVFILVQAGAYWLIARQWIGRSTMPVPVASAFRVLRIGNLAVLAIGLGGVIAWFPAYSGAALITVAVWTFGAIEYLNYYVVRVAYPVGTWFSDIQTRRVPQLVQDLTASANEEASRR